MPNPISQNLPTPFYKSLSAKFFCLIFFCVFSAKTSYSSTVTISGSGSNSTSALSDGDSISFTGSGGILNVDSNRTLFNVSGTSYGFGHVNFNSINTLTISNNTNVNEIAFNADGTLNVENDLYSINGITTTLDNSGNITLSGSGTSTHIQSINSDIGTSSKKLKSITASGSSYYTELDGDIYTHNFIVYLLVLNLYE